jgi:hypothetical protein
MPESLKPCPFCDSPALTLCHVELPTKPPRSIHFVGCTNCLARGSQCLDKDRAIARWNAAARKTARAGKGGAQ